MTREIKPAMNPATLPLPFDPAKLNGLSERLLLSHHQNNYGGAVKRLQAIRTELAALDWAGTPGFRINGLKREELIAANSMGLHELYFSSLGGDGKLKPAGKPAGFGVALRYAAAVEASTAGPAVAAAEVKDSAPAKRIDVRRKGAFDAAPDVIEGAVWRDPELVDQWASELAGTEVVVYCVYGHEVGQSTAARLRDAGVTARYLVGGIEDWKAAGLPVRAK